MTRILLAFLLLFTFFGGMAVYEVRTRMSEARLGTDIIYTLDGNGGAQVEMVEKTYFVDDQTRKNFQSLIIRTGQPDAEAFGKRMEGALINLIDRTGKKIMAVRDFQARFDEQPEYGGRVYSFRWDAFADQQDGKWVIDFRQAEGIKLTKDSSLTIVLPPGARLLTADPAATLVIDDNRTLRWQGPGEMPWPYIEYR